MTATVGAPTADAPIAERIVKAASSDDLIAELVRRRSELTEAQRNEVIGAALNLCGTCFTRLRGWLGNFSLVQAVRESLWEWFREWNHGGGCPPEDHPAV